MMHRSHGIRRHAAGFSLIEMMIALMLGLMLVGGTTTLIKGMQRSHDLAGALGDLRRSSRFLVARMSRELRMAGHAGCLGPDNNSMSLADANLPVTRYPAGAVQGALVTDTGWTPAPPSAFTVPTTPTPRIGSHALMVLSAEGDGMPLTAATASTADPLVVAGSTTLQAGNLAVVSGCEFGDLFKIASVSTSSGQSSITPAAALAHRYAPLTEAPESVQLTGIGARVYFVADTGRTASDGTAIHALYQQSWPFTKANPPVQLIDGVDAMRVRFGMLDDSDAMRYLEPNDTNLVIEDVQSVEIGLLISTIDTIAGDVDTNSYVVAGAQYGPPSSLTDTLHHSGGRRLRHALNTTVQLRARVR